MKGRYSHIKNILIANFSHIWDILIANVSNYNSEYPNITSFFSVTPRSFIWSKTTIPSKGTDHSNRVYSVSFTSFNRIFIILPSFINSVNNSLLHGKIMRNFIFKRTRAFGEIGKAQKRDVVCIEIIELGLILKLWKQQIPTRLSFVSGLDKWTVGRFINKKTKVLKIWTDWILIWNHAFHYFKFNNIDTQWNSIKSNFLLALHQKSYIYKGFALSAHQLCRF